MLYLKVQAKETSTNEFLNFVDYVEKNSVESMHEDCIESKCWEMPTEHS